jgi:hypothetical protein
MQPSDAHPDYDTSARRSSRPQPAARETRLAPCRRASANSLYRQTALLRRFSGGQNEKTLTAVNAGEDRAWRFPPSASPAPKVRSLVRRGGDRALCARVRHAGCCHLQVTPFPEQNDQAPPEIFHWAASQPLLFSVLYEGCISISPNMSTRIGSGVFGSRAQAARSRHWDSVRWRTRSEKRDHGCARSRSRLLHFDPRNREISRPYGSHCDLAARQDVARPGLRRLVFIEWDR